MAEVLFELLVEELPTTEVKGIIEQLEDNLRKLFQEENIDCENYEIILTPRRIGFILKGLSEASKEKVVEKRGPAQNIAYDQQGQPTKALLGFLKSNNATLEEVIVKDNYVYVVKKEGGKSSKEILETSIPKIICSFNFRKPMRWGKGEYSFVRIPHNVLAIYNGEVLSLEIFGLKANNKTVGHRFVKDEYFEVLNSDDYFEKMKQFYIILKLEDRKTFIKYQIEEFEKRTGLNVDKSEELIEEIAILTEYPTLVIGTFNEKFLSLPEELITTTIKHHQRSFTIKDSGKITNKFIAFADMPEDTEGNAIKGYERVINARLEDARYYFEKDVKIKLEDFNEKLKGMVFQKQLGTLYDKVLRIEKISEYIANQLKADNILFKVKRTAILSKADIGSHVVYEFPELQGVMGRIYALIQGEDKDAAWAIEEHYRADTKNIFAGIVGIADRLDTIIGNFLIGNIPSGSKDPYGLRVKTDEVFEIIRRFEWDIDVKELIDYSRSLIDVEEGDIRTVYDFFETRFELSLKEFRYDVARAVKHLWRKPLRGILSAEAISKILGDTEFENLIVGFERVHNITKNHNSEDYDSSKFVETAEKELFEKYLEVKHKILENVDHLRYFDALKELIKTKSNIDHYFDKVLVMCEDEDLRYNRLGFLKAIDSLFMLVGDLSQIVH